jgi:hypothetical protein
MAMEVHSIAAGNCYGISRQINSSVCLDGQMSASTRLPSLKSDATPTL